jgi:peptide/nickel transport system permease protein
VWRLIAVRALHAVVVLFLVTTIAFFLLHLAPGDPFSLDNPGVPPEVRIRMREQFGYDRPVLEQYVRYLGRVAQGDFGYSHMLRVPVLRALGDAVPRTLLLMGSALTLSFALGIWLGVFEARHRSTKLGRATNGASLFIYSLPDFWLALMILLTFAYWIPVLPPGGMTDPVMHDFMSPARAALDIGTHLVLPLLTLTLIISAVVARFQRSALFETLPLEFMRTARAKGVPESDVIGTHALRNSLLPMITLAGFAFPALLGGAVFVERVFNWPGMGLLVLNAIAQRDYALVVGSVVLGGFMVVVGNLLADIVYGLADPRVRVR